MSNPHEATVDFYRKYYDFLETKVNVPPQQDSRHMKYRIQMEPVKLSNSEKKTIIAKYQVNEQEVKEIPTKNTPQCFLETKIKREK